MPAEHLDNYKNRNDLNQVIDHSGLRIPLCSECSEAIAKVIREVGLESVAVTLDVEQCGFYDHHITVSVKIRRKPLTSEVRKPVGDEELSHARR